MRNKNKSRIPLPLHISSEHWNGNCEFRFTQLFITSERLTFKYFSLAPLAHTFYSQNVFIIRPERILNIARPAGPVSTTRHYSRSPNEYFITENWNGYTNPNNYRIHIRCDSEVRNSFCINNFRSIRVTCKIKGERNKTRLMAITIHITVLRKYYIYWNLMVNT